MLQTPHHNYPEDQQHKVVDKAADNIHQKDEEIV